MNRRNFINGLLALPAVATAVPAADPGVKIYRHIVNPAWNEAPYATVEFINKAFTKGALVAGFVPGYGHTEIKGINAARLLVDCELVWGFVPLIEPKVNPDDRYDSKFNRVPKYLLELV